MGPDGCPNDKKETFETILEHFEEEVQELKEAVINKDWENIKEELGDLLFNVFLFSKVAENQGNFNLQNLFESTSKKFIENHESIFQDKKIK